MSNPKDVKLPGGHTDEQASAAWNALPFETRKALVANWHWAHIRHLEADKQRLKHHYEVAVREINQQIRSIKEAIDRG